MELQSKPSLFFKYLNPHYSWYMVNANLSHTHTHNPYTNEKDSIINYPTRPTGTI